MVVPFKRCKPGHSSVENFCRFLLFIRSCAGFPGASLKFSTFCTIQSFCGFGLNSYPNRNKINKKTVQFKARSSSQAWHKTPADFTDVKRKGMHNDMSDDLKRIIGVLIHLNIRRKNHSDTLLYYNHVMIATTQMHLLQFVKNILAITINHENFRILFSLIYMVTSPSSDTLMPIP